MISFINFVKNLNRDFTNTIRAITIRGGRFELTCYGEEVGGALGGQAWRLGDGSPRAGEEPGQEAGAGEVGGYQ